MSDEAPVRIRDESLRRRRPGPPRRQSREIQRARPGGSVALWFGLLAAIIWFGLGWRAVSLPEGDFSTEPLSHLTWGNIALLAQPRNEPLALPLAGSANARGGFEYRVRLRWPRYPPGPGPVPGLGYAREFGVRTGELRSLGLYFELEAGASSAWQADVPLGILDAELRLPSGLVLSATDPRKVRRGSLVEFYPLTNATSTAAEGELVVNTDRPGALYLRGVVRSVSKTRPEAGLPPLGRLVIPVEAAAGQPAGTTNLFYLDGRCTYPIPTPRQSRLRVLAGLHEVSEACIRWALVMGGLAMGLGFGWLTWAIGADRNAGVSVAGAVAAIGLGLGLPAAVLVVPMQGPDEAVHALSYGRLSQGRGALDEIFRFGFRSHWDSLRWRPDLKVSGPAFRQRDVYFLPENTLSARVIDTQIQNYDRRSPAVAMLWRAASRVIPEAPGGMSLLALRFIQVALGAALMGVGCGVVASGLVSGGARWIVVAPLTLFSLPVALACVTNYSELAACTVLLVGTAIRQAVRFDSAGWVPFVQGVAVGLIIHIAFNGVGLAVGLAIWLCHRPMLRWLGFGEEEESGAGKRVIRWWVLLALGFMLTRVFSTTDFRQELVSMAGRLVGNRVAAGLVSEPILIWLPWCALLGALELAAVGTASRSWARAVLTGLSAISSLAWVVLGLFAVLSVWFAFHPAPAFADLEQPWRQFSGVPTTGCPLLTVDEMDLKVTSLSLAGQVRRLLAVFFGNLTPWPTDFVMVKAFWTGLLGCEVRVPAWVLPLGATFMLGGLGQGLVVIARTGSPRRTLLALLGAAAVLGILILLTMAYWPRNLYGRYAMPALLLLLWTGHLGWIPLLEWASARRPWLVPAVILSLLLLTHGAWIHALGERFF